MLAATLPCVRHFISGLVIIGCNNGTVASPTLRDSFTHSVILLGAINVRPIIMRNNNPRMSGLLGRLKHRSSHVSNVHIASGDAVSVIRVMLNNDIGGSVIDLVGGRNNHTVNLANGSTGLVLTGGLVVRGVNTSNITIPISLNFINSIIDIGGSIVGVLVSSGFVPIVTPLNISDRNGACGVGTSLITKGITRFLRTRGLVLLAGVGNILNHSNRIIAKLAPGGISDLVRSNAVSNNVVPGVRYTLSTMHDNIGDTIVISNQIPRTALLRVFAGRNINALVDHRVSTTVD